VVSAAPPPDTWNQSTVDPEGIADSTTISEGQLLSTFHSLNFHITFSTKYRKPWIKDDWIERLHAYFGGTVNQLDGKALKLGGVEDHVHLLVALKPSHRLSDLMRELKKSSSKWVHETIGCAPFEWQEGYAAFSVSPTTCPAVSRYIAGQVEHHRKQSFREELIFMLNEAGVDYEPKYLD
jgi:putative transposase